MNDMLHMKGLETLQGQTDGDVEPSVLPASPQHAPDRPLRRWLVGLGALLPGTPTLPDLIIDHRDLYEAARCTSLRLPAPYHLTHGRRNPIAAWLDSMDLFGLRSHEKFIPPQVFSLPQNQLALFLRHLWATDGSITVAKSGAVRVYYGTTSGRLARELQLLLLRFGITARLHAVGNTYGHPQWTVDVKGVKDQRTFMDLIGAYGKRGLAAIAVRRRLDAMTAAGRAQPSRRTRRSGRRGYRSRRRE